MNKQQNVMKCRVESRCYQHVVSLAVFGSFLMYRLSLVKDPPSPSPQEVTSPCHYRILGSLTPQSSSLFFLFIGNVAVENGHTISETYIYIYVIFYLVWDVWFLTGISGWCCFHAGSFPVPCCHVALAHAVSVTK